MDSELLFKLETPFNQAVADVVKLRSMVSLISHYLDRYDSTVEDDRIKLAYEYRFQGAYSAIAEDLLNVIDKNMAEASNCIEEMFEELKRSKAQ